MGYSDGAYVLDTSASRNSNSGHDYGVIECRETRPDRVAQNASSRDIALERQARLGLSYRLRRGRLSHGEISPQRRGEFTDSRYIDNLNSRWRILNRPNQRVEHLANGGQAQAVR